MKNTAQYKVLLILGIAAYMLNFAAYVHYGVYQSRHTMYTIPITRQMETPTTTETHTTQIIRDSLMDIRLSLFPLNNYTDVSRFFLNVSRSNEIAIDRPIPDARAFECTKIDFSGASLPSVTVVIPMHNEPWSTLLRTLHSVINRSSNLLKEILIIDDFSDLPFLGTPLEKYIIALTHINNVDIIMVSSKTRLGTMRARNLGARIAKGDVLVYLDSHTEVGYGWLEPMVWEIYKNHRTVVQPAIDSIDAMTLEYNKYMENMRGEFKWTLGFTFEAIPPRELLGRTATDPIPTPAIVGCCFAIDRQFYLDIGGLDEGMKTWGAEDVELSLRVWMCGGNMKVVECSRVGHIFKAGHPFKMPYEDLLYNEQRIAESWLGDYRDIFYAVHGGMVSPSKSVGNLTAIRTVQEDLRCMTFGWYLENVFPELEVPPRSAVLFGKMKNAASGWCIHLFGYGEGHFFGFDSCWRRESAIISLTKNGFLKTKDGCLGVKNRYVLLFPCDIDDVTQQWSYTTSKQLMWYDGKSCIMHVSDPDPSTNYRQTIMLMSCHQPQHFDFTVWTFSYTLSYPV